MMENNQAALNEGGGSYSGLCSGFTVSDNTETFAQKQDFSQLDMFLSVFFQDEQEPINLRFFDCKTLDNKPLPKNLQIGGKSVLSSRFQIKQGGFHLQGLQGDNKKQGAYFVVNSGGNSDKDITRLNAFFVESDSISISEQNERLDNAPLQPSIRVETGKSIHAYYPIEGDCTVQEWRDMQNRLIKYFNGDKAINNPARVMRLPFFNHVRYDNESANYIYKPVELKVFEPSRCFTLQEMQAAFPALQNEPNLPKTAIQSVEEINSIFSSGQEYDSQEAQELAEKCLQNLSPERCNDYATWRDVGYALYNTFNGNQRGLELWREWSKKSPKYTEGCCENIWNSTNQTGEKITVASLVYWAQEDSIEFRQFWANQTKANDAPKREKQSNILLKSIMGNLDLFHTAEGECFANINNNGHLETHKLDSRAFKDWLSYQFYLQEGKTPNAQTIAEVIQTLTGKARFDSPQAEVFLRVAEKDNAIYVDLCNEDWQVVEITKAGWKILDNSPVKFRRTRAMLALPNPQRGGNLARLKEFINVSQEDFILVLAWLVACLCFNKPYPVLILHGEQGSAKSTTSETLRRLIDPNKANLREKPKDSRDLMVAANNSYVLVYDNLSSLSPEASDTLCRVATGGGFSTRELYSNDEETIFNVARPIILNGIEETASRSDLLDRALIVECPRITEQGRKTKAEIEKAFTSEQGKLLGALFDAVSCALRELPNVKLEKSPRMADFARWACAAEKAFNLPGISFIERYQSNRETAHAVTLDSSPVGKALVKFMQSRAEWQGTAEELRGLLTSSFDSGLNGFPKTARALSGVLKRIAPTLRASGIEYINNRTGNARLITLTRQT